MECPYQVNKDPRMIYEMSIDLSKILVKYVEWNVSINLSKILECYMECLYQFIYNPSRAKVSSECVENYFSSVTLKTCIHFLTGPPKPQ